MFVLNLLLLMVLAIAHGVFQLVKFLLLLPVSIILLTICWFMEVFENIKSPNRERF